jgi:hypothetical protein
VNPLRENFMKTSSKRKNAQFVSHVDFVTGQSGEIITAIMFECPASTIGPAKTTQAVQKSGVLVLNENSKPCACDICRAQSSEPASDQVCVYEVWTSSESFITDQAHIACGIASALGRSVRIRSKLLPRGQVEGMKKML